MFNFGKRPSRSLESFGVAGLLGDECEIFYENLFSSHHIGRVSDLLSARLRKSGLDELRFRALLLFGFFEAYRSQPESGASVLGQPITLECGVDDERVAIGVTLLLPAEFEFESAGLTDRLARGKPKGEFEVLLEELKSQADRLLIRHQASKRKIEVIALLGIPGKLEESDLGERSAFVVDLPASLPEAPPARTYTLLGDLDYPELLKDDQSGKRASAPIAVGEIVSGRDFSDNAAIRIAGETARNDERIVIEGVTQKITDEVIRVKGGDPSVLDDSEIRIPGNAEQIRSYQNKISELERRLAEMEAGKLPHEGGEGSPSQSLFSGFLRKVWPFRKDPEPVSVEALQEKVDAAVAEADEVISSEDVSGKTAEKAAETGDAAKPEPANPEAVAKNLLLEIQAGRLDSTINRAKKEVVEIKKEIGSERAKKWVEGLMGELVAEKARLQESAKKLNLSVRQKELEFRNKEQALAEELRRKEEALRQKNNAVSRLKDQLAEVTMTLERLKANTQSLSDDAHFKQKYSLTQKMLNAVKDENKQLLDKIDELRSQVSSATLAAAKTRGPSQADVTALKQKNDRMLRQIDELKRANQQLTEKAAENKKERAGTPGTVEDLKKRLDAAMKLSAAHEKESEQLQLRLEEAQREEGRLKKELSVLRAELDSAKGKKAA